jgi:thioesterase domain-containing protein
VTIRCALATRHATRRAENNYSPVMLPLPVWLFEARENDPPTSEGWRAFLGDRIHVISVPGRHTTMMQGEERLKSLGAAVSKAIAANNDR